MKKQFYFVQILYFKKNISYNVISTVIMPVIEWIEDNKFIAISKTSHAFVVDGDTKIGSGAMELILISVASCTAVDIVNILKKMRSKMQKLKVYIDGKRAPVHPKVYTEITIKYQVFGEIEEKDLKKAIELSQNKYCSASIMLKNAGVKFVIKYEIISATRHLQGP